MQSLTKAQKQLYDWLMQYVREHEPAPSMREITPSIREMVEAMGLKSTSAIQSRLQYLHDKGYIYWYKSAEGRSRRTRIRVPCPAIEAEAEWGLPVMGTIAAGDLVEPFTDAIERIDLPLLFHQPQCFVLRVTGDSMIEEHIRAGDYVILQQVPEPQQIRNGTIVAANVRGETTLKRFYRQGNRITLQPANPNFQPIAVAAADLVVQGVLVGVWRDLT
jgi:repressor LexA